MSRFVGLVVLTTSICLSLVATGIAAEQDTAARPLPTPRQWKILAALDAATELDFRDQPLTDVIDYFEQKHEIEIQLDNKALGDAGLGSDTPISMRLKDITLRSTLRLLLDNLDLTYVVGDGYLLITSKTEAENKLSSKVYPVQDLVTLDSDFRRPLSPGEPARADFQSLIELMTSTVQPTTWNEVGGPGSIKEFEQSQALAVSQTDQVHEEIAQLLAALRGTRDKQLAAAKPVDPFLQQQPAKNKEPVEIKVYRLIRRAPVEPQVEARSAAAEKQANAAPAAADKPADEADRGSASAGELAADGKLGAWAKAIAKLVPEMIEQESWQPSGDGTIRAVGETLVVRQTDEVQQRIGKLINEMLPGSVHPSMLRYYHAVRLSMPSVKVRWPHEAEPQPRNVEARISEVLNAQCELDFSDVPLATVLNKIEDEHPLQIYLDHKALTDAGIGSDTPITRSIRGLSLRTALKLMLDELDLTYLIRDELLVITSKTEAENMLSTKVYPVFDLVVRRPGAATNRPALGFRSLIENIQSNIAATTWDDVGGPGAIQSFTNAGAIVVSQTTQVHEEIAEFLKALREVGEEQKK